MNNDEYPTTDGMTDTQVLYRQKHSRKTTVKPGQKVRALDNVLCQRFVHPFPLMFTRVK